MILAGSPIGLLSHQTTIPFSGVVFAVIGALVLPRQPRNPIVWLMVGLALLTGVEVLDIGYLAYSSLSAPGEVIPAPAVAHWLMQWIYTPRGAIPLTLFLLLFPDGKLPSPRWRLLAWAAVVCLTGTTLVGAVSAGSWEGMGGIVTNPFGLQSQILDIALYIFGGLEIPIYLGCMASVFVRFREAHGTERQQLKWMAYTIALILAMFVVGGILLAAFAKGRVALEIAFSLVNLATILVSVAVGVSILRYRLFDIDLIINRTLVYSALSILVVGLYVLVVGSLGVVFQSRESLPIALGATGLIAVLFQPMRDRLQRLVNRMLFGDRDDPYNVLSRLGRDLAGPEAPGTMLSSVVRTISQTLKLPYVAIALQRDGTSEIVSQAGLPAANQIAIPLEYKGRSIGWLICAPRSPDESFTEAEDDLLRDIARQSAVAMHALTLNVALRRSHERLVTTREEERKRLRRDLHDGLGPELASLGIKIDIVRNALPKDAEPVDQMLVELRSQVRDAVRELRRLVSDLRPPALDELGLLEALKASAVVQVSGGDLQVTVQGPGEIPPLPAAVEVAAYRIAQEAVTNVARHANAHHCHVQLRVGSRLELEIVDDGVGLPVAFQAGVGLSSMEERTAELGGEFRVMGRPGTGTKVVAKIPLPQESS
jgi:two-component system NarL family sensor kinase